MNCENHLQTPATAYCRTCGKPVCDECRRDAFGTVFCAEHVPAGAAGAPPPPGFATGPSTPPPGPPPAMNYVDAGVSPGQAFFLGWIPGVGAIYNGQYAKGLVHAVIWGLLVSILSAHEMHGLEPIFGMLITVWMFYMAFEAYHTARRRRVGEPVDEYSSILDLHGHNVPVAGIMLIVLGVVLLLNTLNILDFDRVARYWPVLLIAAGVWLLYGRLMGRASAGYPPHEEVRHERR
jgi:hypothetical protein